MTATTCEQWSRPARVERRNVAAPTGRTTTVASLDGGRWSACTAVLDVPTGWETAEHVVRLVTRLGAARFTLATTTARLDWTTAGGRRVARIDVAGSVADGFELEIAPVVEGVQIGVDPDLSDGRITLEARGGADAADAVTAAERLDKTITPRRGPILGGVLYGLDPTGEHRPLAVDASGALELAAGGIRPRAHDTTYDPIALFQLAGDGACELGSETLTKSAGTFSRAMWGPLEGMRSGDTYLTGAPNVHHLTGDMTIELLCSPARQDEGSAQYIAIESASGETEATNNLWALALGATSPPMFNYSAEEGAGAGIAFAATEGPLSGVLQHVAMTREAGVVRFYLNGHLWATSGALNAPTGGTASFLTIGGGPGLNSFEGFLASVKLLDRALTAAEVLREANFCLFGGA